MILFACGRVVIVQITGELKFAFMNCGIYYC